MLPDSFRDVDVRLRPVARDLEGVVADGVLWRANQSAFVLDVPEVATYLATDGQSLDVDPAAGSVEEEVRRVARMTPLAALAWQQGLLALHAAVAVNRHGAVLLAGDSSSGKSTLLAALLARGWQMLSDDLAIVRVPAHGKPVVVPVGAEMALWPDALARLGPGVGSLGWHGRAEEGGLEARALLSAGDGFLAEPRPLRAIYWLSTSHRPEVELVDLTGLERFGAVTTLAYNTRIASALCERPAALANADAVANTAAIRRLHRPRGQWTIAALADLVDEGSA